MIFRYEGVDALGNSLKGELDAIHRHAALRQLSDKGVIVIELSEQAAVARAPWFTPRLTRDQLLQALHELTTLITSGVTLSEGIDALIEGGHHPKIEQAFRTMGRALQQGENFSTSLAQSKLPLPDYLFHLVRAGEATGELGEALSRALEKMQFDQRTGNELRNALTYPIVLVLAGLSAVVLMFAVVVPKFTGMLGHGKVTLPWLAEMVLSTGEWFNANWDLLLIALILCLVGLAMASVRAMCGSACLTECRACPWWVNGFIRAMLQAGLIPWLPCWDPGSSYCRRLNYHAALFVFRLASVGWGR
ncbi:type II secretion system F family protein [Aeromonas hydrophila]|uniref:type II secretion system F family protein n=1 Tax=Aeromonas hydrophila TaxID=644 RepID=UPI003F7A142F